MPLSLSSAPSESPNLGPKCPTWASGESPGTWVASALLSWQLSSWLWPRCAAAAAPPCQGPGTQCDHDRPTLLPSGGPAFNLKFGSSLAQARRASGTAVP